MKDLSAVDRVVLLSFASAFIYLTIHQVNKKYNDYTVKHPSVHDLRQMSNGANDRAAQRALAILDNSEPFLKGADHFYRAELRDLNTHEGFRPSHTRTDEHRILQDYTYALRKPGAEKWMQDRIQDYIDRRREQYESSNLSPPSQYRELENILNHTKFEDRLKQKEIAKTIDKVQRLERKIEWTENDNQNVHDSGVQNTLKSLIHQVHEKDNEIVLPLEITNVADDITDYIIKGDFSDEIKSKALVACHRSMQSHASHPTLSHLSEKDILTMVWRRSYHVSNSTKNAEDIKDMVVHNLADTISTIDPKNAMNIEQVCVTGRIGRIMDSLTLTDADSIHWKRPLSVEAMRNDVLEFTHKTLTDHIAQCETDDLNPLMQKVAQSYKDPMIEVSTSDELLFTQPVVSKSEEYLEKMYGDTMSETHKMDVLRSVRDSLA